MVVDALSCMTMVNVSHVDEEKKELVKHDRRFASSGVLLEDSTNSGFMVHHNLD